ncbi:embryonic polarity protein dorsal-like [Wyeomyia smithii]|uniref:embryonic polarity protein dorsal-like n=1 Tax=Wyeomyia smithii TaxID=174621 RepID=UPI002467ACBA|nr:embryonic polarity protein dorsal-like [Wyeomyia smithii]
MPPIVQEKPYVVITEQPQSKALRFRYECEGRSAGSIPGVHSTPEQKTYPSIEIRGYKGRAIAVVSCVTKDPPYRPHPHNLVGKEGCKEGVCTVHIDSSTMSYVFSNLGIQCVKKKGIEESLMQRKRIKVDPFHTQFGHAKQPATIDLNAVRLCFQVYLPGPDGKFTQPLQPVVSDIIFDKKAMSDLVICKLSHVTAPVSGGKEIILLCEKVTKEDISVRFYEEQQGRILWTDTGEFQHHNVHKQVAISFRTPRYRTLDVEQSVMVHIQLRRPSDGATSEPLPFELVPVDTLSQKRKRQKMSSCEITDFNPAFGGQMINIPTESARANRREASPQFRGFNGPYRNPNDTAVIQPSPAAHQGNNSPFMTEHSMPVPRAYQPGPANDFFMTGQHSQYQYNYPGTASGYAHHQQPHLRTQQQPQNAFQLPANPGNMHYNGNNDMATGGLPAMGNPGVECNIGNIVEMDLGFTMTSSEYKSLIGNLGTADIKQEHYQQRMQEEEENLSNSFTRLTTNPMNDLGK